MAYIGSKPNDTRQLARREFSYAVTVASTTTFTGSDAGGKTLSYQPGELEVYMNGVRLDPADYTATTGSSVVLGSGANIGDNINIFAGQILPTDDYVSKAAGGTFDGNLLVGGTTYSQNSSEKLSVFGRTGIEANGSVVLGLDRQTSDGEILQFRKDNGTIGSVGVGNTDNLFIQGNSSHAGIQFGTNSAMPHTNGNTSDNAEDLGTSNTRWKDLYLSGGVYLGGTGAANKLDDYEEGTWTPRIVGSSSESGQSYQRQEGYYTKIGNKVLCRFILNFSQRGSFSGDYIMDGFPFNCEGPADINLGSLYHSYVGQNVIYIGLYNRPNDNKAYIWIKTQAGQSREYPNSSFLTNDTELSGSFTIQTTA